MNWEQIIEILKWVAIFAFGLLSAYWKANKKLQEKVANAINEAEIEFSEQQKAGEAKMEYAIDIVYSYVPTIFKPLITKEFIRSLIQAVFDEMANFAKKQLDKLTGTDK